MLNFTRGEEKHMEKVCIPITYTRAPFPYSYSQIFKELADSGVKVIIAGTTVGELALHYLNRSQILVLKVLSKFDLRRLCRVVQATPLARLGAPTPEEAGYVDV
jgi:T-complex protein 1 subunit theta